MMVYLFQNIGQLAGFFLKQNEDSCSEKSAAQISDVTFESIFDSFAGLFKNKLSNISENSHLNENIELVERMFLDADTLKALIEKQGNIVTLEISSDEISHYLDDLSLTSANKRHSSTVPLTDFAWGTNELGINEFAKSTYRISFNAADIFNSDYLPVGFINDEGQKTTQLINVTRLVRLIGEYPDPIQMEIEIIPERDKINDLNELKSAFKFDLKNLIVSDAAKSSKSIEGLVSLTAGHLSKNTAVDNNRDNIYKGSPPIYKQSLPKPILFEPEGLQRNYISPQVNDLDGLFPLNQKTSISLLGLKTQTPHGDNINHQSEGYVVPESLNGIESTGAGEVNSDNKDNSSALSKISADSRGASETVSIRLKNGSLDGFTDHYEPLRAVSIKNSPGVNEELLLRNYENIESIKAGIISSLGRGHSTVRMRLHPPDLGTLHIKLHLRAGTLTTEFRVENAKAGEVVSAILPQLKASLEEANLKLTDINVVVDDRGKDFSSAHNPHYHSGSTGNGQDRKDRSSFKDYDKLDNKIFDEKTGRIGNLESGSVHKGWVDLKA